MPHHKSCFKRLRKSNDERIRNNALRTILKKTLKDARTKITEGNAIDLNNLYSNIDSITSRGAIPRKRASRIKSRMAKAAAKLAVKKD